MWFVTFVLLLCNGSWMLFVSPAFHSVLFPSWLIKIPYCCGRLFTVRCVLLYRAVLLKFIIVTRVTDQNEQS
jgi:hypothetical protein